MKLTEISSEKLLSSYRNSESNQSRLGDKARQRLSEKHQASLQVDSLPSVNGQEKDGKRQGCLPGPVVDNAQMVTQNDWDSEGKDK